MSLDTEVRYSVPLQWNDEMRAAAFKLADEMTEDREKRAYIVGLIYIAWPRLLDAVSSRR